MEMRIKIIVIGLLAIIFLASPITSFAHPGRTASDGCHYCRTNCDSWGVPWNERHCHGGSPTYIPTSEYIPSPTKYVPPPTIPPNKSTHKPEPTKKKTLIKKPGFVTTTIEPKSRSGNKIKQRKFISPVPTSAGSAQADFETAPSVQFSGDVGSWLERFHKKF